MADKELGALSPIETLLAAALFHTVQQGNSRKVTAQQIADFVNGNYPAFIQTLLSAQDADDVYAAIGAAPEAEHAGNADKLGGQLPTFFAAAQDVATAFEQLTKADVGLGNVDNTSDEDKPVSTAQQTALDQKVTGPALPVADGAFAGFADTTGRLLKALSALEALTIVKGAGAYAKDNILGTVSQTSGVPTGAIIERGSNANGSYVRFADGTQTCVMIRAVTGSGAGVRTFTLTYPVAFAAGPSLLGDAMAWGASFRYTGPTTATIPGTTSAVSVGVEVTQAGAGTVDVIIRAEGRWF